MYIIFKKQIYPAFAVHPWEYLKDEIEARWLTQKEFSEIIWKSPSELNELIKWKRNITPIWAILIATVFDVSPDTWLNLQHEYDLYQVREKISKVDLNNIVKKVKTKNFHLV